jgi:hypothetical protein
MDAAECEEIVSCALMEGASVGAALAAFRESPAARRTGVAFALFGDPDLRIASAGAAAKVERYFHRRAVAATLGAATAMQNPNGFLSTLLTRRCQRLGEPQERLDLAKRVEREASNGELQEAVLRRLMERNTLLFQDWTPLAGHVELHPSATDRCLACGSASVSHRVVFEDWNVERRVRFCPSCGLVEDSATEPERALVYEGGGAFRFVGKAIAKDWRAGLIVGGSKADEFKAYDWPAGADGTLARYFHPSDAEDWPTGPLRTALYALEGINLSCWMQPAHRASPVHV